MTTNLTRRTALTTLSLATFTTLSACAALPTSGPVTESQPGLSAPDPLLQTADGPADGASPEELVSAFLLACVAGFSDDFSTARQFLAGPALHSWTPESAVYVYVASSTVDVTQDTDGSVSVSAPAVGTVDHSGLLTLAEEPSDHEARFTLATNPSGQWRIIALPDGVFLSSSTFTSTFVTQRLNFLTPTRTRLVPDIRWFPRRKLATRLVNALLAGPSPWLAPGVVTAIPSGTTLGVGGIEVNEGTARVELSADLLQSSDADRLLAGAQIRSTLLQLPTVRDVDIVADQTQFPSDADSLADDGSVSQVNTYVGITPAGIVQRTQPSAFSLAISADSLSGLNPRWPLPIPRGDQSATQFVLSTNQGLMAIDSVTNQRTVISQQLTPIPAIADGYGWIWSANDTALHAYSLQGTVNAIESDWLEQGTILAMDLSAESTRMVILRHLPQTEKQSADGSQASDEASENEASNTASDEHGHEVIDVAVVIRDDSGMPTGLGPAVRIARGDFSAVTWSDDVNIAALTGDPHDTQLRVRLATVGGLSNTIDAPDDAVHIASNRLDGVLVAQDAKGDLQVRSGATWRLTVDDVTDVRYPLAVMKTN
ncbi:GerMN domain-containing protein [Actinomyces vulturis]|uniref:GerMN domain-containing protein n=1 Tax=Actinomyces vulturis TaxID=1857645 RepID=UPI00082CFA2A|nr:GerMN domain-containing protein [Actinomyces vulturis]